MRVNLKIPLIYISIVLISFILKLLRGYFDWGLCIDRDREIIASKAIKIDF